MPDFHIERDEAESKSDHACRYILRRTTVDHNFAYYMRNTESLSLVIAAVSELTDESADDIESRVYRAIASHPMPDICRMERAIDERPHEVPERLDVRSMATKLANIREYMEFVRVSGEPLSLEKLDDIMAGIILPELA